MRSSSAHANTIGPIVITVNRVVAPRYVGLSCGLAAHFQSLTHATTAAVRLCNIVVTERSLSKVYHQIHRVR